MRIGTRITGSYDEAEDRLRLAILDADGNPLALWLTQRLANRLVRAVAGLLDKEVTQVAPAAPAQKRASVQYFEQASAELKMGGGAPVKAPADTLLGVVKTIHIKHGNSKVVLEFVCDDEDGVSLPLAMIPLRQVMRVFYRLYKKADWPVDGIWPAYFDDEAHEELLGPNQIN